jgi:hypothetical protein
MMCDSALLSSQSTRLDKIFQQSNLGACSVERNFDWKGQIASSTHKTSGLDDDLSLQLNTIVVSQSTCLAIMVSCVLFKHTNCPY